MYVVCFSLKCSSTEPVRGARTSHVLADRRVRRGLPSRAPLRRHNENGFRPHAAGEQTTNRKAAKSPKAKAETQDAKRQASAHLIVRRAEISKGALARVGRVGQPASRAMRSSAQLSAALLPSFFLATRQQPSVPRRWHVASRSVAFPGGSGCVPCLRGRRCAALRTPHSSGPAPTGANNSPGDREHVRSPAVVVNSADSLARSLLRSGRRKLPEMFVFL